MCGLGRALAARGAFDYAFLLPPGAPALGGSALPVPAWCRGRALRILYECLLLPRALARAGASLLHAPAYVAPPRAACPVVLSVYDLHVYTHPGLCRRANVLHYRARLPGSIRRAAAVIVPSAHTRAALLARFPRAAERTHVIPLGLADAWLTPPAPGDAARVRTVHGLPPRYLLHVGDLAPRKNLPGLFTAWLRLRGTQPDLELLLAGAPGGAALDLPPGVRRLGYVPEADLPALYAQARMLVYPSLDEGFGLPVLEAMAAGCPVVCASGAPAEFAEGAARFCDPRDPASIADAAAEWLTDEPARLEAAAVGRRLAARFTWDRTAAAVETVYRQAAGRWRPGNE